jgi:hypothetical protein
MPNLLDAANFTALDPGNSFIRGLMAGDQRQANHLNRQLVQQQIENNQSNAELEQRNRDIKMLGFIGQGLDGIPQDQQQQVFSQLRTAAGDLGFDISDLPDQLDNNMVSRLNLAKNIAFGGTNPNQLKIREEVRKDVRKNINDISGAAETITTNFNKIGNLANEISSGNRQAVAQGIIALVKLGEPNSTVREGEMLAALNAENPLAAVTSVFEKNGVQGVGDAILRRIDPLNPKSIKIGDLLSTADALIKSSVPQIQQRFQIQKELASNNLSQDGMRSLFTDSLENMLSGLSDLSNAPQSKSAPANVLQEARDAINNGAPREAVIKRMQENGFDVSGL